MGTQFQGQRSEDAIVISPENSINWQEFTEPILKKHKNAEGTPWKKPNCLFFKTRLCLKFMSGSCANGPNCNFAHGCQELRKPPANRQEPIAKDGSAGVEQILVANKICRKFYRGEACSYGERCAFVHVEPGMLGENPNVSKGNRAGLELGDEIIGSGSGKPMFWKTRMCNKWEAMGYCSFGEKCHFAHGHAELMEFKKYFELQRSNTAAAPPPKPQHQQQMKVVSLSTAAPSARQHQGKGFLKWKGQMVSHIYADWIDDNPPRTCSSPPPKAGN